MDQIIPSLRQIAEDLAEVRRLQAIIRAAIPHQGNAEVARWLRAGLTPGVPVHDHQGKQIA